MIIKMSLFTPMMLYAFFAFGEAEPCAKEMSGKKACVAGELMLCNKEYDLIMQDFRYEWHAVNDDGQPFDIYLNKEYKQLPGYTPAKCSVAVIEKEKDKDKKKL